MANKYTGMSKSSFWFFIAIIALGSLLSFFVVVKAVPEDEWIAYVACITSFFWGSLIVFIVSRFLNKEAKVIEEEERTAIPSVEQVEDGDLVVPIKSPLIFKICFVGTLVLALVSMILFNFILGVYCLMIGRSEKWWLYLMQPKTSEDLLKARAVYGKRVRLIKILGWVLLVFSISRLVVPVLFGV